LKVRIDTDLVDELHFPNIKDKQIMGLDEILLLINQRDEVDLTFHVDAGFEGEHDLVILPILFPFLLHILKS